MGAFKICDNSSLQNKQHVVLPFLFVWMFDSRIKSVTMENVPGILYVKQHMNYMKTVASALIGIGMHVQIQVLDSSRYVWSI